MLMTETKNMNVLLKRKRAHHREEYEDVGRAEGRISRKEGESRREG